MKNRRSNHPPKYCRVRCSGRSDRAYCTLNGQRIWLGAYGSEASKQRYADLIGMDEVASVRRPPTVFTVAMVMARYLEHAQAYYRRPDGNPGREYELIRESLRFVRKNCSSLPAQEFGPKRLKLIREAMIAANHSRKFINKNIDRVRRMFRWAASEELVPVEVYTALRTVAGLKLGRCEARETEPVMPVADWTIEATLPHLSQVVADMVKLQRTTGMRPAEICLLRPCDIEHGGDVWIYRPPTHKTAHLGRERVVPLGPRAQELLLRYLARNSEEYCFRPVDSEQKRRAELHANRKTPLSCGNSPGTNRREKPKLSVGNAYDSNSYRRAIHRACDKAFPHPELGSKVRTDMTPTQIRELKQWQSEHRWSPNQLRHAAATEIRKQFGLEAAQIILGHSQADVTQVYAERDLAKGLEVARMIG